MSYNKTDYTRSDARCTSPPRMSGFAGCGEGSRGLRRGMPLLHGCCLSRPGEEPCYQQAEDEPADVGKNATPPPIAPLAPSSGTRASAAVPNSKVIAVCVIIAAKPPAK